MERKYGPWKIKNSKVVYQNLWIRVREDAVVRPNGSDGMYGVVEMVPGVSVLAMDADGNVYLTKEFRYAIGRESIEVVSGAIDDGEEPIDAAKRELKEELGIEAEDWLDLGLLDPFTSLVNSSARLFVARGLRFSEPNQDAAEKIEMMKVTFQEAVQMVMRSEITQGQSVGLILKAARVLNLRV